MAIRTRLVETGRFLTILPDSALHFGARRLRMKTLRVALPAESRPVQVVTLRHRTANPIAKLFIDELRTFTKPLTAYVGGRRMTEVVGPPSSKDRWTRKLLPRPPRLPSTKR